MAARKQFKIAVAKDNLVFASAHFITFSGHRCETLHGHNYRTRVVVEGGLDPEAHFVLDFSEVKQITKRLTDEVDHKVLLPLQNPKIEIREEGDTVTVAVGGKPRYVFPKGDCALLPIPNTTVEMLRSISRDGSRGRSRRRRGATCGRSESRSGETSANPRTTARPLR